MLKTKILHTELNKYNDDQNTPYEFFNDLNRKEKMIFIKYVKH